MAEPGGEHAELLALEETVRADLATYAQCLLTDKARVAKLSAAIQDKLSRIRALTRDLELEVEELDRWSAGMVAASDARRSGLPPSLPLGSC